MAGARRWGGGRRGPSPACPALRPPTPADEPGSVRMPMTEGTRDVGAGTNTGASEVHARGSRRGWVDRRGPERPDFWRETGRRIAWRTLIVTTVSLTLSFASWFMMSAVVVRLPAVGFTFSTMELFWLTAMRGGEGGPVRIVNMFLIPIFGT